MCISLSLFSGWDRSFLGIPADWETVHEWIKGDKTFQTPEEPHLVLAPRKHPNIPLLSSYKFPPPPSFWENFPKCDLPTRPQSQVQPQVIESYLQQVQGKLTVHQLVRARLACSEIRSGTDACQLEPLPGIRVTNAASVYRHGSVFTDTLAEWVRKKFVAGPFSAPPLEDFRCNSMIAVEKKGKVRIVMNMSGPDGYSFNENIDTVRLEKISTSSARAFAYSVEECGKGARMWKFDLKDAYKNMPAQQTDLRLQGFSWLGKFFVETQLPFGGKHAVPGFDRLGGTLEAVAAAVADFPKKWIHRTVDDTAIVTPASSSLGEKFAAAYKKLCAEANISLAENCPENDKAFEDSCVGTVLGIRFDTTTMCWSVPQDKANRILQSISEPLTGAPVSLKQTQRLLGRLNDFSQMCRFLQGFKQPVNQFLASFQNSEQIHLQMPAQAKKDLKVWGAAVAHSTGSIPIPPRPLPPPSGALVFVSDAAGVKFARVQGKRVPLDEPGERGAASIGLTPWGSVWFHSSIRWSSYLLTEAMDSKGCAYGCKSATLEAVGLLLPFVTIPGRLRNKAVRLQVDNISLVYGWVNKHQKNDTSASILIRSIHIIAVMLNCMVEVEHLPRVTSPAAILADNLSRTSTTTAADRRAVAGAASGPIPRALTDWLNCPFDDWDLPYKLLDHAITLSK